MVKKHTIPRTTALCRHLFMRVNVHKGKGRKLVMEGQKLCFVCNSLLKRECLIKSQQPDQRLLFPPKCCAALLALHPSALTARDPFCVLAVFVLCSPCGCVLP